MSYGGRIAILPGQSKAEEFSTLVHETGARDVAQGRAAHGHHQDGTRDRGRSHRVCHRQSRRTRNRNGIRRLCGVASYVTFDGETRMVSGFCCFEDNIIEVV